MGMGMGWGGNNREREGKRRTLNEKDSGFGGFRDLIMLGP